MFVIILTQVLCTDFQMVIPVGVHATPARQAFSFHLKGEEAEAQGM